MIGELSIWLIVGLWFGLVLSIDLINRDKSWEYWVGIFAKDPLTILRAKNCKLLAVKGGLREHISKRMAPNDQISVLKE